MLDSRFGLSAFALSLILFPRFAQPQSGPVTWPQTSAANVGLSDARLHALSAAIRSEEFKKIGSVLIARHGKLAYEDYVDGGCCQPA